MRVRGLDSNGDWLFGKGRSDYKKNRDALMQNISTRLRSFLGDCFFDTSSGIDWFHLLGGKSKAAIVTEVSSVITNTDGVTGIVALSVNIDDNRAIRVSYNITTVFEANVVLSGDFVFGNGFLLSEDSKKISTEDGDHLVI